MNLPNKSTSDPLPNSKILTPNSRIYVAGHNGMVGSAIFRQLRAEGYTNIITRTHAELDLTEQPAVRDFFRNQKIDMVILAAARVGGIHANNTYPAEFIYHNLMIQTHVIHEACRTGVERLLFLGSSCIYPKYAPQPMREEHLLTGYLEPTNEPYAIAKIAGIKLCESYNRQYGTRYRAVMPTNLYGPNDNFDLETSHVLPAMIRKFHLAKLAAQGDWQGIRQDELRFGRIPEDIRASLSALSTPKNPDPYLPPPAVRLWGSGKAKREFLYVDDMALACIFVLNLTDKQYDTVRMLSSDDKDSEAIAHPTVSHINIGSGRDLEIKRLAETVKTAIGYEGEVVWDPSKPNGMPRKLLDVSRLNRLGWNSKIDLQDGIRRTYQWYLGQSDI
ncbi:MAG: GDP-L-fucose synthase [Desulfobacterales bacterium]|nr:MAG: GDP-L-fucose synthase [Desulfobacterales bacterium]